MERGGGSDFSHKNGGVDNIAGVVLIKEGVLLIFIITNPFECYLSLNVWCFYVCVFCLFAPFLSV